MTDDPWRAYLRDHHSYVLQTRRQSRAFLHGERLGAITLNLNSKVQAPAGNAPADLDGWVDTDYPTPVNLAARFPPRTPQVVVVDIDADLRPADGTWTAARLTQAKAGLELLFGIILEIGGITSRYLWGRESLGHWGHLYLPVAVENKEGLARLLSLSMKKPVTIGAFKLRIEVRCAPEAKSPIRKPFTLPGSVYPHPVNDNQYDLIGWQITPPTLPAVFPPRPPEPLQNLARGLWAGLLAIALMPHWDQGSRHDVALLVAGVLARETLDDLALLDADQAKAAMTAFCTAFRDNELKDRLATFDASLARLQSGAAVTGYRLLGELLGDDVRLALLRLRGGSDPDALDSLLGQIAYAKIASGRPDVYLDFATGPHAAVVCDSAAIVRHFHPHPAYPPQPVLKGKPVPLIHQAMNSTRLIRYESAMDLPGIPFGAVLLRDRETYRLASDDEKLDTGLLRHVNIGPGFATTQVEEPTDLAWMRWCGLWQRHLIALTNNNIAAMVKLEQAIAWVIKHPLEKIPLGLCLTGDGGIGKSVTFNVILTEILGPLVGFTNVLGLEGQFRLHDLEGKLFYVIEEVNLSGAPLPLKELLKDLMKNPKFDINRKYGAKNTINNYAVPIFLTNEKNPNIVVAGQPERSLVLIQGMTRENQKMTIAEWRTFRDKIGRDVAEFVEALKDPEVREAAMCYFANIAVERASFNDNSVLGATADPREELDPLDEALCSILEANELHSRLRGDFPLTLPFRTEWLIQGVEERFRARGVSRRDLTARIALKRLRTLLGDEDSIKPAIFKDGGGRTRQINYFTMRYGDMITAASRTLGVELEPAYALEDHDFGPNEVTPEACRRAWEAVLVNNNGY